MSRLYIGSYTGASPASDDWIEVAIRSITWQNFETGELSQYDSVLNCKSIYERVPTTTPLPSLAATPTPSNAPSKTAADISGPVPAPTEFVPVPTADTCLLESASSRPLTPACRNALLNVHYTLIHRTNSENNIVAAYVDLVLTDVPLAASNDDGKIVLQQEYSVEFQDVSNSPRNLANLINRSKSGNPGYIYGRPVLAGHAIAATSQLDAVSPRARGLQLLGADNDGTCTDAATERAKHPESRSLNVLHHYYKGHLIFWGGHAVRVSTSAKLQPGTRLLCRSRSARHGECCPALF
mmetsp:Transcript_14433/g.47157  ORF Transcript_14433/g.47157 Transcript_14433/m.47157 type:complete len:296 (-) Transcript_14433:694-1581(-)